jgi:hypothetical protein
MPETSRRLERVKDPSDFSPPRQRTTHTDTLKASPHSDAFNFSGGDGGGFHVARAAWRKLETSDFTARLISRGVAESGAFEA